MSPDLQVLATFVAAFLGGLFGVGLAETLALLWYGLDELAVDDVGDDAEMA